MHAQTFSDPITRLWHAARAMFARMCDAIGPAEAIQVLRRVPRADLKAMRDWLRPLEALVRQIVFIEASALVRRPNGPAMSMTRTIRTLFKPYAPPEPDAPPPRQRKPSLRLWPKPAPPPVRIRMLGRATSVEEIYRERRRVALAARLALCRWRRGPPALRIAQRMEAVARILDKPKAAIRRLARKLTAAPRLALKLATRRTPRSPHADPQVQDLAAGAAYQAGVDSS